jgi:16S rRNA (adenine1518-N6/adenine1519-N6)-dimethyltransferase
MKRPRIFPINKTSSSGRRRALGQHFLTDSKVADRIVELFAPERGEVVLEVGPGRGVLTERLLRAETVVVAIEKDASLASALRDRFGQEARLHLDEGDARDSDLQTLLLQHLGPGGERKARVLANLPYSVGGQILAGFFEQSRMLSSITVLLQKEVVDRICARPGSRTYGSLSVLAQYYSSPKPLMSVKPGSFSPPPKVTSTLVTMPLRDQRELKPSQETLYSRFARQLFSARRRTLPHNLKSMVEKDARFLAAQLESGGIDSQRRPETLTRTECLAIFRLLLELKAPGLQPSSSAPDLSSKFSS